MTQNLLLAFVAFLAWCMGAQASPCLPHDAVHHAIKADGYQCEYWLYVPCSAHRRADLVIMLHGWGGSAEELARTFGWRLQADRYGFVVAFPQGLPIRADFPKDATLPPVGRWRAQNSPGWWTSDQLRAESNTHHPDDTQFLLHLKSELQALQLISDLPVFIAGFSNGAFMAKHLALTHPEAVRAVVAAGYVGDVFPATLRKPVPLLQLIGGADETGAISEANWQKIRPVEREYWWDSAMVRPTPSSDVKHWAALDGCHPPGIEKTERWGKTIRWSQCKSNSSVMLITIDDLGHQWLGASNSRWAETHPAGALLSFTAIAADFFQQHR